MGLDPVHVDAPKAPHTVTVSFENAHAAFSFVDELYSFGYQGIVVDENGEPVEWGAYEETSP